MSSSDGFCSAVTFAPGELGQIYQQIVVPSAGVGILPSAPSSNQSTPAPTPVIAHPIPLSRQTSNPAIASLSGLPGRPSSRSRSNSAASNVTQPPHAPGSSHALVGTTSQASSRPSSAFGAAASQQGAPMSTTLPFTTPPRTPMARGGTPSSSVAGANTLGKRDSTNTSAEREQGESIAVPVKRRKIEPTPVPKDDEASTKDGGS